MATKNNPGAWDCYAKAAPDEPIFVLRATDPVAPYLVLMWGGITDILGGTDPAKLNESKACAKAMRDYFVEHRPDGLRELERVWRAVLSFCKSAPDA